MLQYLLLDVDDTLYSSDAGVADEIDRRMNLYITQRLGYSDADVWSVRREFQTRFGSTLEGVRQRHCVEPSEFLDFVHNLPLGQYLEQDLALDAMLGRIRLTKVLFTNSSAKHASRVVQRLGVDRHFNKIIDLHDLGFLAKPDPSAYSFVLDYLGASAKECVLVDNAPENLVPAHQMGIKTVLIGSCASCVADAQIERITELETVLHSFEILKVQN